MDYRPGSLSGGQRQRVAISRALAHGPKLVLADEPTAALDATIGRKIVDLFQEMARGGCTVFMVTHDKRVLDAADRIVTMLDGAITSDVTTKRTLQLCEFLSGVPAFSALTPAALSEVAEHMSARVVEEGTAVVRQGDEGDAFYLVAEGSVRVSAREASGGDVERAVLGPGQFFGEAALLKGEPRNATVTARERSLLYVLAKPEFYAALLRSGDMKHQLLNVLFQRQ
jgi:putative ABC transport system ATP-binding protein